MTTPDWTPSLGAVTVVVSDPAASKAFYDKAFSAPIVFETDDSVVFGFGGTVIDLLLWVPSQRPDVPALGPADRLLPGS